MFWNPENITIYSSIVDVYVHYITFAWVFTVALRSQQ